MDEGGREGGRGRGERRERGEGESGRGRESIVHVHYYQMYSILYRVRLASLVV